MNKRATLYFLVAALAALAAYYFLQRRTPTPPTTPPRTGDTPRRLSPVDADPSPAARPDAAPSATGGAVAAPTQLAQGEVVARGAWGGKLGEFGRRHDPESNPEGPMAVAARPDGSVDVLDQINRRVQRWKDGKVVSSIPVGGDTVQDIVPGEGGRTLLLDRLADKNVQVYDENGKLANEVPLAGKGIDETGTVTGVFSRKDGIYVERDHGALVRIADPRGNGDKERPEIPGRPSRDGRLFLTARLVNPGFGEVAVVAVDAETRQPAWTAAVSLGAPILQLTLLDSDRQGRVYLGADTGRESEVPPYGIIDEAVVVAQIGSGGQVRGMLRLPAWKSADETFRPLTVGDDGAIYQMVPTGDGMTVFRYVFP